MYKTIIVICILLFAITVQAHNELEKVYQKQWCDSRHGKLEYVLPDQTRVDCLTKNYAIEFDFAHKWAEAVGQSLYYAHMTGKKAGIVLIIENESDYKHLLKLDKLTKKHNIRFWTIKNMKGESK